MKFSLLSLIFASTVLSSSFDSSESTSLEEEINSLNKLKLVESNGVKVEDLNSWLLEKKAEMESFTTSESPDMTTNSTVSSDSYSPSISIKTISPVPASPKEFFETELSDQDHIKAFSSAIREKDFTLAINHLKQISNWKMTLDNSNVSVLSFICKYVKSKFLGKLNHPRAMEIFAPLLEGKHSKLSGGYIAALSLFRADIQREVMSRLISSAPHLRGFLLQISIYYKLNESVIKMLLDSGALINFVGRIDFNPLHGIPSLRSNNSQHQFPLTQRFFMNFNEPIHFYDDFSRRTSPDAEVNFLMGMIQDCVPDEIGVLRVAFENYKPEIVMALIDNSPVPLMTNYHLAHLIAKAGPPASNNPYPPIESLVDPRIVFDRLSNGESDLIALAYMSFLSGADQNLMIDQFMAKTKIFQSHNLHNPRTISNSTTKSFAQHTGLSELPSSPADVFLLTACKWNVDDQVFRKIYSACEKIANRQFWVAKSAALKWATKNNLTGKIEILA